MIRMKKTVLFLAEGFEELEAIAVVDVLRRAEIEVRTVSISDNPEVVGAHGVTLVADLVWNELEAGDTDCLIFPGGMPGALHLGSCEPLISLLQQHYDKGRPIAAICAAPAMVLSHLNAGRKLRLTCYPGFEKYLPDAEVLPDGVVVDKGVISGKGPGFAVQFGLAIVEYLCPAGKAEEVAAGMLL